MITRPSTYIDIMSIEEMNIKSHRNTREINLEKQKIKYSLDMVLARVSNPSNKINSIEELPGNRYRNRGNEEFEKG